MSQYDRDFRLSKDVLPSRYDLRFELDLDRWSSAGWERITLRTARATREIVLHAVELDVTSASLDGRNALANARFETEAQVDTEVAHAERGHVVVDVVVRALDADFVAQTPEDVRPELAALGGAEQGQDDPPMEGQDELRHRGGHRQQGGHALSQPGLLNHCSPLS